MQTDNTWYRNPWVWLLIAIPGLTVLGCTVTLYLALTHPVSLVSDVVQPAPIISGSPADGGE
jgi:hypothetical protein